MKNSTNKSTNRNAAFNVVNEQVLAGLKAEGLKWFKPWRMPNGDIYSPVNWVTGRAYNGINALLLSSVARLEGYTSGEWATYKNISDNGGQIRKGEKGTGIVYWVQSFRNKETGAFYPTEKALNKAGFSKLDSVIEDIWSLKYYKVFNIEQADNIESKVPVNAEPTEVAPIPQAEDIYNNYKKAPKLLHGGNEAYYSPTFDKVQMPEAKYFVDVDSYYKTLFHELIHSTGHESRLKREGVVKHDGFGSELYSKEELVAEIGAWYLAGLCNLDPKDGAFNSQAYINGWVKHLENKEREVVYAMSQAQKAVNHILEGKGAETPEPSKKVSKEPVLASKQITTAPTEEELLTDDIKTIDKVLETFALTTSTVNELKQIKAHAVNDIIYNYTKGYEINTEEITADDDNGETLAKFLKSRYGVDAFELADFTVATAKKLGKAVECIIWVSKFNRNHGGDLVYIYNSTFAGEPCICFAYVHDETRLESNQVTIRRNSNQYKDKFEDYLLSCIDVDGDEDATAEEKMNYIFERFESEYNYPQNKQRYPNLQNRVEEWLRGLAINVLYYNYDIDALYQELTGRTRISDKEIENYWNECAYHLIRLMDKHCEGNKPFKLYSNQVTIYEQGVCPNCGGEELEYEGIKINTCGEHIHYPFECRECGSTGDEYYKLEYVDTVGHREKSDSESRLHSRQVSIKRTKTKWEKKEQAVRILGMIKDRITDIKTLSGGWIMTDNVLRVVLKEHKEVRNEWDSLHSRFDFIRRELWKLPSKQVTINAPKVELKEITCYQNITEVEGVFEIEQEGKYIATVYALAQWDENARRGITIKDFKNYAIFYKEDYGFEIENTGDLSAETIDKLWESLEENL